MEKVKYLFLALVIMLFVVESSIAQSGDELAIATEKKGAFNESADIAEEIIEDEIPYYYRHHKKLPTYFTGYVIELTTSDLPLRRDYSLFERFGNVYVKQLEEGGFSYVIKGFRNEKSAASFLNNIVIHNAPEAKVIYLNKGEKKSKK